MKTIRIRILSVLLAFGMLTGLLPWYAAALEPEYEVTEAYRKSIYYERLCRVELTGNDAEDLLRVALSQVGYHEGNNASQLDGSNLQGSKDYSEYGYWFGMYGNKKGRGHYYSWCAMFVTWCARQAGIPTSVISNSAYATIGSRTYGFNKCPYYDKEGFEPRPGDLIIFYRDDDMADNAHVGLVYRVIGNTVTVVEGNKYNQVRVRLFSLSDPYIQGYGRPNYRGELPAAPERVEAECDTTVPAQIWTHTVTGADVPIYQDFSRTVTADSIAPGEECIISGFYTNGTAQVLVEREDGWHLFYTETAALLPSPSEQSIYVADAELPVRVRPDAEAPAYVPIAAGDRVTVIGAAEGFLQVLYTRSLGSSYGGWIAADALEGSAPYSMYGDANGDGKVNSADVLTLRKYLADFDYVNGTSLKRAASGSDANGDGSTDSRDLLLMRRYMANYDYSSKKSSVVLGPAES